MRRLLPLLTLAAAVAISAQTAPKASTAPAQTKAGTATKSSPATTSTTASKSAATTASYKLPPGEKRIPGIARVALAVKYQDIKIGTGPVGEPEKLWHVKYKGWRAADGVVFDSWNQHPQPLRDKDGKPEMGPDGKPKMGDPEPMPFPQGMGRLIVGFDNGVTGMHVGGKRRIFIPWQLAYGTRAMPDRPDHPGIPAKSDLIFDVELVQVTDMPAQPQNPMVRPMPQRPSAPGQPGAAPKPETPATPPTGTAPGAPATPPAGTAPAAPPTPPTGSAPSTPPPPPSGA